MANWRLGRFEARRGDEAGSVGTEAGKGVSLTDAIAPNAGDPGANPAGALTGRPIDPVSETMARQRPPLPGVGCSPFRDVIVSDLDDAVQAAEVESCTALQSPDHPAVGPKQLLVAPAMKGGAAPSDGGLQALTA